MDAKHIIEQAQNLLRNAGFSNAKYVTAEEFEDGIGAGIGYNLTRKENDVVVWYTDVQAMDEIRKVFVAYNPKNPTQKKQYKSFQSVKDWEKFVIYKDAEIEFKIN